MKAPMKPGALAAADRDEINFAPGAYERSTQPGRFRIAHEFAHVVQFAAEPPLGGRPVLSSIEAAEADARQAASRRARGPAPAGGRIPGLRPAP